MEQRPSTVKDKKVVEEGPVGMALDETKPEKASPDDAVPEPVMKPAFNLGSIKTPNLTEPAVSIYDILIAALNSNDSESEKTAARALDRLCPPTASSEGVGTYLWALWSMVLEVSRAMPHDTEKPGQGNLVSILYELQQCAKGDVGLWGDEWRLWRDLPLLGNFMESNWQDPTTDHETLTTESARAWRNQNAFAARCVAEGVASWAHFGIWQLRAALETGVLLPGSDVQECKILAASEWIIHCGQLTFRWVEEEEGEDKEPYYWDTDVTTGPLFQGKPGLSVKRWDFWKARLSEISKEELPWNEEVRAGAREAVKKMKQAEERGSSSLEA